LAGRLASQFFKSATQYNKTRITLFYIDFNHFMDYHGSRHIKDPKVNNKTHIIFNAVGFQLGWWLCVLGVINDLPLLGPAYMAVFLGIHYQLFRNGREFLLILFAGVAGTFLDSLYTSFGLLTFSGGYGYNWLAPLWITAMWVGFTATLNHALVWLKNRPVFGFLMGAVFGPLSYFSGEALGVISIESPPILASAVLALVWGTSIVLLYELNDYLGVDQA
jgi:hypothetical protein